jgi:nitronate monooxygenase
MKPQDHFFDALVRQGIDQPIFQAPMAGGATTPALIAAVAQAGVFGALAGAALSPSDITAQVAQIRALTARPFSINLFVLPDVTPAPKSEIQSAWAKFSAQRTSVGLPENLLPPVTFSERFSLQLDALVAAQPFAASFTFGILNPEQIRRLQDAGIFVIGTATHVEEALAWQQLGADAVCAQGFEAGGHRGTFLAPSSSLLSGASPMTVATSQRVAATGLFALLPLIVDALHIPVIAAGGIMDGRGIAAARVFGARAAQLGTVFLTTQESGIATAWKKALLSASHHETTLTRAFSGRYARGLRNSFIADREDAEHSIPDYPIQNALTAGLRKQAAIVADPQNLSLWAGQGVGLLKNRIAEPRAADLIKALVDEYQKARAKIAAP